LGISQIPEYWSVFKAFNPIWAVRLLTQYPHGFWLLGAVFMYNRGRSIV
jgi:KUP system potassium uptake protein